MSLNMIINLCVVVFGAGISALLAAIYFRLGVLKEMQTELKEFKEKSFKVFMTREACRLTRQSCNKN